MLSLPRGIFAITRSSILLQIPLLLLGVCLTSTSASAERVFVANWKGGADKLVYETNLKSEADLVVYRTVLESEALTTPGVWFFTSIRNRADLKLSLIHI